MSYTQTRSVSNLLGTPSSPSTVTANTTTTPSTVLDLTQTNSGAGGVSQATITTALIAGGTAPTTPCTAQPQYTEDGTNWVPDGPPVSITMVASTTYYVRYDPPLAAQKARVQVTCGNINNITAWEQGCVLIESS